MPKVLRVLRVKIIKAMSEFFTESRKFVNSILNQRMMLIRFSKCNVANVDKLRMCTEQLKQELMTCQGDRTIAYFLYKNYTELKKVMPHSPGFEKREEKLREFYFISFKIIN